MDRRIQLNEGNADYISASPGSQSIQNKQDFGYKPDLEIRGICYEL
ncbi:MAG: hypothetical protein K6F00_07060 [Lachnospiraceae bacterium]|nr:hypothetical protein [Lachnospiraceae bacterium]